LLFIGVVGWKTNAGEFEQWTGALSIGLALWWIDIL